MKYFTLIVWLFFCGIHSGKAQSLYFPPNNNSEWDSMQPSELGWCQEKIDSLYTFLKNKNTKSFMVLVDGKIVLEKYFDGFNKESNWYWASAAKSFTSMLVGIAQEDGFVNINNKTSDYLGTGWTSCPSAKENLITVRNQLTMTTGLDDKIDTTLEEPQDCIDPACLQYKADPGTRWAYHNAPYHLLQNVVSNATGIDFNTYTDQKISNKIGMNGIWIDYIYYSTARSMARYGLLALNKGIWKNDTILKDTSYFRQMVNTSQNLNKSYGYLWWLNGKGSYKLPGLQITYNGDLIPNAPDDMYAALGKNDQKLYIIPSMNMVVVRMGDYAISPLFATSEFDNILWKKLMAIGCTTTGIIDHENRMDIELFPNPSSDKVYIRLEKDGHYSLELADLTGKTIIQQTVDGNEFPLDLSNLAKGMYILKIDNGYQYAISKVIKN